MKYEITEEQIKELAKGNAKVQRWFPEAFETKLEIGKWYKNKNIPETIINCQINTENEKYGYGIHVDTWGEQWGLLNYNDYVLATESEVFEALKKEAVKRGFVDGAKFKSNLSEQAKTTTVRINNEWGFDFYAFSNSLHCATPEKEWDSSQSNPKVFADGKWAEIIKEKTLSKSEAEKLINEFKNDDYTYKIV